jgi:osmotically-inducible protein OsmY
MLNKLIHVTSHSTRSILLATVVAFSGAGCASLATHEESCSAGCSDKSISDAVRRSLFNDASISDTNITVSTVNGIVYLHGLVGTSVEREAAIAEASRVAGVVRVVNSIEINGAG